MVLLNWRKKEKHLHTHTIPHRPYSHKTAVEVLHAQNGRISFYKNELLPTEPEFFCLFIFHFCYNLKLFFEIMG